MQLVTAIVLYLNLKFKVEKVSARKQYLNFVFSFKINSKIVLIHKRSLVSKKAAVFQSLSFKSFNQVHK